MTLPDGFEWVGQFGMDCVDWQNKIRVADVRSVDIHPSGMWAVVDMGDTTAWIRIPADVTSVQWERQAELREIRAQHHQNRCSDHYRDGLAQPSAREQL